MCRNVSKRRRRGVRWTPCRFGLCQCRNKVWTKWQLKQYKECLEEELENVKMKMRDAGFSDGDSDDDHSDDAGDDDDDDNDDRGGNNGGNSSSTLVPVTPSASHPVVPHISHNGSAIGMLRAEALRRRAAASLRLG